jgi:NTP pyrophosphatase (non-canonical NTP hydrolase)
MIREIAAQISDNKFFWVMPARVNVPLAGRVMPYAEFVATLVKDMPTKTLDILHAAVGISGEAGELLDAVKKHWAYERPLDRDNAIIELGDMFYYATMMMVLLDTTFDEVLQKNVNKLGKRYANLTYSNEAATARADDPHVANSANSIKE